MVEALGSFIVFLLFFTLVFYYQRLVSLREKALTFLQNNFKGLRKLKKKILSIKKGYDDYKIYEFEPYEEMVELLYKNISSLGKNYLALLRLQRERLNEFFKSKPRHVISYEKLRLLFEKKYWDNFLDKEKNIQNQLQSVFKASKYADSLLENIDRLPTVTALRVNEIVNNLNEISIKLNFLQEKGVRGRTLEIHFQKYKLIEAETEKIPENYYNGQQRKIRNIVIVTVFAHKILKSIKSECQNLLSNVNNCHALYQQGEDITNNTRAFLRTMQKKLQEMPKTLDLQKENILAENISNQFETVINEFKKPSVEQISVLINKMEKIGQEVQDLLESINKLEERIIRLSTLLDDTGNRIQTLQAGFQSQSGQSKYPVRWDIFQKKIENIYQRIQDIGPINQKRDSLQVEDDLKKLGVVDSSINELENIFSKNIGQTKELRDYSKQAKRIYRFDWYKRTEDFIEQVMSHSPILKILAFVSQRLVFGIFVLLSIIFLSYLGIDMAGGTRFGPAILESLSKSSQYVGQIMQGELGLTRAGSNTLVPRPVIEVIVEFLPRSLGLLGISLLFASLIGILLGVLAARGRSQRSLGIIITTLIGISVPSFFAAFLLQWAVTTYTRQTGVILLPVGGFGWDNHLILPALVLAARPVAQITRITFVSVRDVLRQDFIRTAHSKGVHRSIIMAVHVMRNAAIPILTVIGVSLRFSLSSLPVVEYYFGWTGIGFALLKGIAQQDNNLTVALALCMGIIFITINILLDLSYQIIDPRIREKSSHVAKGEKQNSLENIKSNLKDFVVLLADNAIVDWFRKRQVSLTKTEDKIDASLKTFRRFPQKSEKTSGLQAKVGFPWAEVLKNVPLIVGGLLVLGLILVVFFGPQMAPNNPYHTQNFIKVDGEISVPPFAPNDTYPWGTDALGRDMMSLILSGAQQTLILGFMAVIARILVGVILGAISGWSSGGRLDRFILGLAEIISAFPTLLLGMIIILALGIRQGMRPFIIALCFIGWGEIMQYVRGEVMAIRPKPFIEGAVAVGAQTPRIVLRHIMPNLFSSLISITALEMGAVLMLLGELGFISIFIGGGAIIDLANGRMLYADVPEWGALLSNLRYQARSYPWTAIYPMLAFFVSILSFNLFGEGIRRLVERGSLIVNRVFNRYTVTAGLLLIIGFNWLSTNSGALPFYKQQARAFDGDRAMNYVMKLVDPAMNGRALGSDGMNSAAQYIASEFEALGLQSAGQKNTYFQNRKRAFERLTSIPELSIHDNGPQPIHGDDFAAYPGYHMTDGQASAPIRFIGMGKPSTVQVSGWRQTYPELERSDFSGEILMVLSDREADYLTRFPKDGLLVVVDDPTKLKQRHTLSGRSGKMLNYFTGNVSGNEIPSLWITEEVANRLLTGSGYTVSELREMNKELPTEAVYQLPLQAQVSMQLSGTLEERWPVQNVIGHMPGVWGYELCTDCLDSDLIVVMAQYDSPPIGPTGEIYPAAINNASGVAVMLETIRVLQETDYQPYRSFLFVVYSGEGLDGGEPVFDPDVNRFLQAKTGFATSYDLEAVVQLRGLGGGSGNRLQVSAAGSLRLANLLESTAKQMGVKVVRADEAINISVIYDSGNLTQESGQDAPTVRLYWEGWENYSRLPTDRLEYVSAQNLESAGRTLAMLLMIMGREVEY